jgi:hypothetical protein
VKSLDVNIEVYCTVNGIGVLRQGSFRVNKDVVNTSYEFVKLIQKDYPYDLVLRKVILNGDKGITEDVNKLYN